MWVQLLAGPPALESLVKVSSKSGAPTQGEYSETIELLVVFSSLGCQSDSKISCWRFLFVSQTLGADMESVIGE